MGADNILFACVWADNGSGIGFQLGKRIEKIVVLCVQFEAVETAETKQ